MIHEPTYDAYMKVIKGFYDKGMITIEQYAGCLRRYKSLS